MALYDAIQSLVDAGAIKQNPVQWFVASVSVGIFQQHPVLDLDYAEDSSADTDMNIVMTEQQKFIEVQGTAEGHCFDDQELQQMLALGKAGINSIIEKQKQCLA